jgi:hypothetical protein
MLLLVQSKALDKAPYKLSGAVAKLADITFSSLAFSTGSINLGFLLRENLLLCSSYLPLGVPNWVVICPHQANFLAPLSGKKKTFARGVSHAHHLLCFCFALLYFYLHRFYQKYKKISFLLVVIFTCLLFVLLEWVLMRTPSCVILQALIIVILSALLLHHLLLLQIFMRLNLLY